MVAPLRFPTLFASAAAVAVGAACGGGPSAANTRPPRPARPVASATAKPSVATPPKTAATVVGTFGEGTFGPRVVRSGGRAIVVSAPKTASGRRWIATPLDDRDAPIAGVQHEIAEAPAEASAWDVKPVGDGWVLAFTRNDGGGEQLLSVPLATDGAPRATPTPIARSADALVAVRIVPLAGVALLTWGERTIAKSGAPTGTWWARALDPLGRPTAAGPTKIAERLSAWQLATVGPQAVVAAYVERLEGRDPPARAARVVTIGLGPKGVMLSEPVTIAAEEALPQIEVVGTAPGRALVVFADRREVDAHLFSAAVAIEAGKPRLLAPAKRAVPARGEQAIAGLVPSMDGAALLYEDVGPRSNREPARRFAIARLGALGEATGTPRAFRYPYEDQAPELARAGDADVALLTYAPACRTSGDAPPVCESNDPRPWIVRFAGPTLSPKAAELLDPGSAPRHAFDLSCEEARCEALVEGPGDPATFAIARVPATPAAGAVRWAFGALVDRPSSAPRVEAASALGREIEFTGLHAARTGVGAIVGWITYAADDADVKTVGSKGGKAVVKTKPAETGARVAIRLVDSGGEPLGPVTSVSERALSKGDVAVAWSAADASGVVAYVSRAEGDEEVYAAKIDGKGAKGKSARITNAPGPASDVAITTLPDGGYLLAWIDGRKGTPAVFACRLDKNGAKVGPEARIGGGVFGDLSDLAVATLAGGRVIAAWTDGREDPTRGFGDVWTTIFSPKELAAAAASERVLAKTALHAHGAAIAARPDGGAIVVWLEDDPSASEFLEHRGRDGWGPRLARIDASGAIVQSPTAIDLAPEVGRGVATGVSVECATTCRIASVHAAPDGLLALAGTMNAAGTVPGGLRPIWAWAGAPTQEAAPALAGGALFLAEDGFEKDDGRVRRLAVAW
jgi:hypothetical protein